KRLTYKETVRHFHLPMIKKSNRREFIKDIALLTTASLVPGAVWADMKGSKMKLGLVTYLWGKDWDVPSLIANCGQAKIYGVELRTQHAHGVEPSISQA